MGDTILILQTTLTALSTNLALLNTAINTLNLNLKTAIINGKFTITIAIASVSRADFDSLKTALAGFELPTSPLLLALNYSETG